MEALFSRMPTLLVGKRLGLESVFCEGAERETEGQRAIKTLLTQKSIAAAATFVIKLTIVFNKVSHFRPRSQGKYRYLK